MIAVLVCGISINLSFNVSAKISKKEYHQALKEHPLVGFKSSKPCVYIKYKGKPLKYNTVIYATKSKNRITKKIKINREKVEIQRAIHSFQLVWYKDKNGRNLGKEWFKKYYSATEKWLKAHKKKVIPGNFVDDASVEEMLNGPTEMDELFTSDDYYLEMKQKKNTYEAPLAVESSSAVKFGYINFSYSYKRWKSDEWGDDFIQVRYKMKGFNKKLMKNNYLDKTQSSIGFVTMNRDKDISKKAEIRHDYILKRNNQKIEGINTYPKIRKRVFKSPAKKKSKKYYKKHGNRWDYSMVFYDVKYNPKKVPTIAVNADKLVNWFYDYSSIYLDGRLLCQSCCKLMQEDWEHEPGVMYSYIPVNTELDRTIFVK